MAGSLVQIAESTVARLDWAARPNSWLRAGTWSMLVLVFALYAGRFDDPVVLQAVDEVEALTTGLSRKISQQIMILDAAASRSS